MMGVEEENGTLEKIVIPAEQALSDKKLKGQLVNREELYGKFADVAAKTEKLMPSVEGFLETEGIENSWRIRQEDIAKEVDLLSSRKQFDIILPEDHGSVSRLQFLKNHFLLASINKFGQLHYQDVTMGEMVGNYKTGLGRTDVMQVNPFNSMPLLLWVIRVIHEPFYSERIPYEDVLGIGHSMGWSSILISGSGEPNFDSWVANPFETSKQRREKEVRSLLDKLPPETIMLNPTNIGSVRPMKKKNVTKQEKEAAIEAAKDTEFKYKTKGKNKPSKMLS
ncbi:hypothetical protein G4B88_010837 [Cannabis sativa]|uniref:BING4 C-terminal domain-containing protein n=1 Tax=Cannabis sativa TaxID=3483 RepID=A0A7J6HJD5_CANSA|nr:hypothetical protein G4B88_010837 [Cannabis sativa]